MTQHTDYAWLDEILLDYARFVEKLPRGKTYGADLAKQAIIDHIEKARPEPAHSCVTHKHLPCHGCGVDEYTNNLRRRKILAMNKTNKSRTISADGKEYKIVFVPENITPLSEYAALYMASGYSYDAVCSLLAGLKESSLYENQ